MLNKLSCPLCIQLRLFSLMMITSIYLYYQFFGKTHKVQNIVHHHVLASEVSTHSATSQILP